MNKTVVLLVNTLPRFLMLLAFSLGITCSADDIPGTGDLEAQAALVAVPINLRARPSSSSALPISLRWDAVPGATSYNVYRATSAGAQDAAPFATTTTSTFTDANVTAGPPPIYFYKVAAVGPGGTSGKSVETSTPTPLPVSAGSGNVAGVIIGNRTVYYARDALLDGFDWFQKLNGWFPQLLGSSGSIAPGQLVVDMAYADIETMAFNAVTVPTGGLYTVAFRYAFAAGLFPNVTNRQMGLMVNGVVITRTMRFPRTGSFDVYQESALQVNLRAGRNSIIMFAVTEHGVSRVDTLAVSPASGSSPAAPTNLSARPGDGSVLLSWTGSAGATSYNIYRGPVSDGEAIAAVATTNGSTTTFTDTARTNGTTYFYNVAAINAVGTSPSSNEVSVKPVAGGSGAVAIACGNGAVGNFVADGFFSGGTVSSGTTMAIDTSPVSNPAPVTVYQHGRKGNSTYTVPGFTPGSTRTVRLDFAEFFHGAAAKRIFNVTINGTQVLTNFDIFAAAGGAFRANAQTFTTIANGQGQVVIAFTTGAADTPLVSGIEIN
ncbi:MAG TPA: malectin domain-containing carbohydrate-binding protein [Polyangia bacterium]|nr:malectin domain-containing carbohydrate-binding protein [Polyangia bacterium]